MKNFKRILSVLLVVAMVIGTLATAAFAEGDGAVLTSVYASYAAEGHSNAPVSDAVFAAKDNQITVNILTTTDMHGRAYDWNSYTDSRLDNNFLQAAVIIGQQRALADDTILVDNGDILQGSALTSYNNTQEGGVKNPMGIALRYLNYDIFNLGNHEFNYGPQLQWNYYNYLMDKSGTVGSPVDVVCANIIENETQQSVFAPYKLFPYTFPDGTTYTIGVIAFENMNNANWDVASHYEGCNFAHAENSTMSYVYEYETYWKQELEQKADFIVVMEHSGEGSTSNLSQENQGAYFISHTDGVDLLITGHSHGAKNTTVENKNGVAVPVINAGGSNVGKLEVTLTNTDGVVTATCGQPTLIALSTAGRANGRDYVSTNEDYNALKALLKPAFTKADEFVNATIGTVSGQWDNVSSFHYAQGDSYDLVHKAQLWAVTLATGIDPTQNHVISMTSAVSSNSFKIANLLADGKTSAPITLKDCYSLYKYDNNTLFFIRITGEKLLNWMQTTTMAYRYNNSGNLTGAGFGTDQFYGLNYDVYLGNPDGQRVVNVTYADGTPVLPTDEIYLALSSYRLSATEGSDSYGWYGATGITSDSPEVVWDATIDDRFNTVGGSVPLIVGEYIKSLTAEGKDVTPGRDTNWAIHSGPSEVTLDLVELTDIHGSIGTSTNDTAGRMAVQIKEIQDANPKGTYVLGGGDFYQGSVVSNLFNGKPVQDWMDYVGFDVETVGNHEFDWTLDTLVSSTLANTTTPMLNCNIKYTATNEPYFEKGSVILDKQGVRILFVGVLCECTSAIAANKMEGYYIDDPTQCFIDEVNSHDSADYDLIIPVVHGDGSSLTNLAKLADQGYPIPCVFGGHSHSTVATNYTTPGGHHVPYYVASSNNNGLIHTTLTYSFATGEYSVPDASVGANYFKLNSKAPAADSPLYDYYLGAWQIVKDYEANQDYRDLVDEIVGYSSIDLPRRTTQMNDFSCETIGWLGNKALDEMNPDRIPTKGVIALTNSGGLRCHWNVWSDKLYNQNGSIPYALLYAYSPFENYIYGVDVTYETFMKFVNYMVDNNQMSILFSGMNIVYDNTRPAGERVLYVANEDGYVFQPGDMITIVSHDFVIPGGDNFTMFLNVTDENGVTLAERMMGTEEAPAYTPGGIRDSIYEWLKDYNKEKLATYDQKGEFSPEGWKDLADVMDPTVHTVNASVLGNAAHLLEQYAPYLGAEKDNLIGKYNAAVEALDAAKAGTADDYRALSPYFTELSAAVTAAQKEALKNLLVEIKAVLGEVENDALNAAISDANKILSGNGGRLNAGTVLDNVWKAYQALLADVTTYTDVVPGKWYYNDVMEATRLGLFNGMGNGTFAPKGELAREQMVVLLWRAAGEPAAEYTGTFSDVPDGKWYTEAVAWAAKTGITNGMGNGKFGVGTSTTREQMICFLYRLAESVGCDMTAQGDLSVFTDADSVAKYAAASMEWAVGTGLIQGAPAGEGVALQPKKALTRAECASILVRFVHFPW